MNLFQRTGRPQPKSQWGLVAVLALAIVSISAICFQQSRTIEVQRTLIRQLFQDSLQLNAMRMQRQQAHQHR